jgi:hypothetical protein
MNKSHLTINLEQLNWIHFYNYMKL